MPLSEHEQRMLDEIESALYAEDPKFASNVTGRRLGRPSQRRRLQAAAVFVVGLVLLVVGLNFVKIGDFPILSLAGFLVMFGAGLLALWGDRDGAAEQSANQKSGADSGKGSGKRNNADRPKFSERMEDRFNKRFEEGDDR